MESMEKSEARGQAGAAEYSPGHVVVGGRDWR